MSDLFVIKDTLDAFLIGAFFFGLIFSAISLLLGAADVGGVHGGHMHSGQMHAGHVHAGDGHGHAHASHGGQHGQESPVAVLNVSTILAFVTWLGGVGYILRNGFSLPAIVALLGGLAAGVAGGWIVLKVLIAFKRQEHYLDASRERLTGSIGKVTLPIREGGTGEIVYELNGVRQTSAARVANGTMLARGAEVIVLKRERGIAFVEPLLRLDPDEDWERRFQLAEGDVGTHAPPGGTELIDHRTTS